MGIYGGLGKWGGWRRRGNGFRRVSLFTLPFRLLRGGKAADFSAFPHLRCLLALLRGGKATNFSAFPHLRCLDAHAPKTIFFAKPIVTPPLVWYNTGYHRIVIQGIIVCFQTCLHGWGTSFETLVQSTRMEI